MSIDLLDRAFPEEPTEPVVGRVDPTTLIAIASGTDEFAILDVREPGELQSVGTILAAVPLPLSTFEIRLARAVPRRHTPIVVVDGGGGSDLAERAAVRLDRLGYTDVRILDGGIERWAAEGYEVFAGPMAVGQAFGEFVERAHGTPHIEVADLLARVAAGEDVVILDSRPRPEFVDHHLPGGIEAPGAELLIRAHDLVPSDDALVVVNCAGRTRSILGAQSLIDAGLPNEVVALAGGTMSWLLDGHQLAHGEGDGSRRPAPSAEGRRRTIAAARNLESRFGLSIIDHATLRRFDAEAEARSLFVLDVRTPSAYEAGHLPGSRSTPSWELAPWVFRHVATRNARLVLVDGPDRIRAALTGAWLARLGWGEVHLLADAFTGVDLERGAEPPATEAAGPVDLIAAEILHRRLDSVHAPVVIHVEDSRGYRAGHVPGSFFVQRSALLDHVDDLAGSGSTIVLVSTDGRLAAHAAGELVGRTAGRVRVLEGGVTAWHRAGLPTEAGSDGVVAVPTDVAPSPWDHSGEARLEAFRAYLSWEVDLIGQLDRDPTVPFRTFPED